MGHLEGVHVVKVIHLVRGGPVISILVAVIIYRPLIRRVIDDDGGHRVLRHQTAALSCDGIGWEGRGTRFSGYRTRVVAAVVDGVTGCGYPVICNRSLVAEIDEPRGRLLPCRGFHVLLRKRCGPGRSRIIQAIVLEVVLVGDAASKAVVRCLGTNQKAGDFVPELTRGKWLLGRFF